MPIEQNIPVQEDFPVQEDYGYGSGRSLLYHDIGEEEFGEAVSRTEDIETAGRARSVEQERKSLLSFLGAGLGLAFGGPLPMLLGTYGGKAVEDYMVSEDVGRFGRDEQFELQDINRELREADKADVWGDVLDIGKVAALQYTLGGGSFTDPGNYSPWHIGGKEAATEGMYGKGIFGNIFSKAEGGTATGAGTLWGRWMGKTHPFDPSGSTSIAGSTV